MVGSEQIHDGMVVHSQDGQPLGRVAQVDEGGLVIEAGVLFAREHRVRLAAVAEVKADEVWLRERLHQLQHAEDEAVVAGALPERGAQRVSMHVGERHAVAPGSPAAGHSSAPDARMDGLADGLAPGPAALDDFSSVH
jgi:hypothetical protein